ncbi:MAG: MFS transporter [Yoonia sp.]|nr:MFS transporter [Yoonia sp.]
MALSFGQKAGWGLADMGINVFVVVKQLLVFAFLTTFLGVPANIAGIVTFAVLAFDVVTDPIVGFMSDRTNSRWGRRTPWIAVGAVILAAGIVGLFAVPGDMSWQMNAMWVIAFFGVATIGFTFVTIPYGAMAGEMTQDPKERSTMMAFRMTFASLGLLTAGALVPALAGDTREGYAAAVLMVAPVVVLAIWGMLFFTRRAPRIEAAATGNFLDVLSLVIGNRAFFRLVLLYGLLTLAVALIAAGLQLAALYLMVDDGNSPLSGLASALGVFSTLFAMFIVGSVISQFIWVKTSAALGKTWALIAGVVLYIVVLIAIWMALPATSVTAMALLFLCAGFTNGAYQQIPWAMYPDLMDVTRDESGEAIEGAFSAVWLFGQKVANAIAPLVLGFVLSGAGWQSSTGGVIEQSPAALDALRASLTLVPAGIFVLAILGLLFVYRPVSKHVPSHG